MEEVKLKQTRKHDDDGKMYFEEIIDSKIENIEKTISVLKCHDYVINKGMNPILTSIVHNLCVSNPEDSICLVSPMKKYADYLLFMAKKKRLKYSREKKMLSMIVAQYEKMLDCEECVCDHSHALNNLMVARQIVKLDEKAADFEKSIVDAVSKFNKKSIEQAETALDGYKKLRGDNKGEQKADKGE